MLSTKERRKKNYTIWMRKIFICTWCVTIDEIIKNKTTLTEVWIISHLHALLMIASFSQFYRSMISDYDHHWIRLKKTKSSNCHYENICLNVEYILLFVCQGDWKWIVTLLRSMWSLSQSSHQNDKWSYLSKLLC